MGSKVVLEIFFLNFDALTPRVPIDATFFYSILEFENKICNRRFSIGTCNCD